MKEKTATLLVLAAVLGAPALMAWYACGIRPAQYPPEARVLNLTGVASRGLWTLEPVNNLNYWWKAFPPATLRLTLHERVVLRLHSADVMHRFYVPALALGPYEVEPGHVTEVTFNVDEEGVFQYYCTSLCGNCHFYMTGWIVVARAGEEPPEPPPITCPLCLPEPPPPAAQGVVAQGEYLYRRMACAVCHGPEGRGGVRNYNYLHDEIAGHVTTAAKLFLRSREDADTLLEWMETTTHPLDPADEGPDVGGRRIVKARLDAALSLILDGKNAAKADRSGPEPPLQMPAWKTRLTEWQALAILGYFVSLYSWEESSDGS